MEKNNSIEELLRENETLKSEINDLKLMLEAVTGHSDGIESELLEKIHSGEKLFHVMSKTIPVPFLITQRDTGIIMFSNEYANLALGYSSEVFRTKNALDLYHNPENRLSILRIVSEQGRLEKFEILFKKSDGSILPVCLFSQPIIFMKQDCLFTVIFDLSERKKAEEEKFALEKQLRQTQKMEAIGTLAGGIAHDFNNILTVIFGNIDLIKIMLPEENKIQKFLNNTLIVANRAKDMVRQILDFCRQKESEQKPFQIKPIVSEAATMIKTLIPSAIRLKLQIESESSIIMGDPTQIHQVLMNLCSNAVYAMREKGGIIGITLKEVQLTHPNMIPPDLSPGTYVRLTVSDNGPGIDKKITDRVFDPFFTTKPIGEGTGLGLSVVHGIVKRHGGAVRVESEPGRGSSFSCYFPLLAKTEQIAESDVIQKNLKGGNEKILFVDDEQGILQVYGKFLKSMGYDVVTESDSLKALTLFQKDVHYFDLVISDNIMPNMTGKILAQKISEIRPDIPIIFCSGADDRINKHELNSIGIKKIVSKPYSLYQIADLIRKVMDER